MTAPQEDALFAVSIFDLSDIYAAYRTYASPPVARRDCSRCGYSLPETSDNFSRSRGRWNAWCRACMRTYARERRAASPRVTRTPVNRTFGVEIEFHGDQEEVAAAMRAAGLRCNVESYNHTVYRNGEWKVIGDASVSNGGELVSPVLRGASGFAAIRKASAALRAAGCTVSTSTGLHVHHGVSDLTVSAFKLLAHNWYDTQSAVDQMVSASRRGQRTYTGPLRRGDLSSLDCITSMTARYENSARQVTDYMDRYRALNFNAYAKYGTVEVRQHQGTLNADKIINWIKFGQSVIAAAVAGTVCEAITGEELLTLLAEQGHLPAEVAEYLSGRIAELSRSRGQDTESQDEPDEDNDEDEDDPAWRSSCDCDSCTHSREARYASAS